MPVPIFILELFTALFTAEERLVERVNCKSAHLDTIERLLAVWTFFVLLQPHFETAATSHAFAFLTLFLRLVHHHQADVAGEELVHWGHSLVRI